MSNGYGHPGFNDVPPKTFPACTCVAIPGEPFTHAIACPTNAYQYDAPQEDEEGPMDTKWAPSYRPMP